LRISQAEAGRSTSATRTVVGGHAYSGRQAAPEPSHELPRALPPAVPPALPRDLPPGFAYQHFMEQQHQERQLQHQQQQYQQRQQQQQVHQQPHGGGWAADMQPSREYTPSLSASASDWRSYDPDSARGYVPPYGYAHAPGHGPLVYGLPPGWTVQPPAMQDHPRGGGPDDGAGWDRHGASGPRSSSRSRSAGRRSSGGGGRKLPWERSTDPMLAYMRT
jgi:hypothetical protein